MTNSNGTRLKLALPTKNLEDPTLSFLSAAGLRVHRPNPRQYVASIPAVPQIEVTFQRAWDIFTKVDEASVDLGITGLDIFSERHEDDDNVIVIADQLGFGKAELVFAVPESWIDITSIADLAELSVEYKEQGRDLRIVTKYHHTTRRWLYTKGITHFTLVDAEGALEAAPSLGYADLIVDISATGTTLRENHLKQIAGGTILKSQTCLIGNRRELANSPAKRAGTKTLLELIEAHLRADHYISITCNLRGSSPQALAASLNADTRLSGLLGPSISDVYPRAAENGAAWYTCTLVVERTLLDEAVTHLRSTGGTDITVFTPSYVFSERSDLYDRLLAQLDRTE
ncbi:MAG: ATP phosphoribosyltransferase [Chloroflexi bacterium]|nr:ATP phosphoribosyltransferase [Chloroflexota bacterium]